MCDIPTDLSRRRLVRLASLATGALTVTGVSTLFANEQDTVRRETADLITGPFSPRVKPRDKDADLTLVRGHHQRAAGQLVQLSGRVTNLKGDHGKSLRVDDTTYFGLASSLTAHSRMAGGVSSAPRATAGQ
jgi:hypothetical protein